MAAVGSSISTIFASDSMVRAIATACRWPPDICLTRSRGRVSDFSSLKDLAGAPVHRLVVQHLQGPDAAAQFASEEDVRRRRQIVAQRQILVNDLDAVLARFHRAVQDELLAIEAHGAVARPKIAGDHLDQRGLASTVVSHEADHLPRLQRKRNIVDCLDGAEMFGDVGEFENRHQPSSLPGSQARDRLEP